MAADIGTNHSPHSQFNLVEGNYMGKFGSDGYHGSGSHTVLLRNVVTGWNRWTNATDRIAVQFSPRTGSSKAGAGYETLLKEALAKRRVKVKNAGNIMPVCVRVFVLQSKTW